MGGGRCPGASCSRRLRLGGNLLGSGVAGECVCGNRLRCVLSACLASLYNRYGRNSFRQQIVCHESWQCDLQFDL